jgi:uncharacterized protein YndB with AHSA1/START domain
MQRTIKIKKYLPYPAVQVWKAITDSQTLGQWFMQNDLLPLLHHEFTFRMAPQKGWDGITHCVVTAVEPLRYIAYTYKGKASGEKPLACAGINSDTADSMAKGIFAELDTVLSFTLVAAPGGTILEMTHSGFKGLKMILVRFIMGMGWKKQLNKKLPIVLSKMNSVD